MRSSLKKRIRITKNGAVLRRPMGIDHFRSKKNGRRRRKTRKSRRLNYPL